MKRDTSGDTSPELAAELHAERARAQPAGVYLAADDWRDVGPEARASFRARIATAFREATAAELGGRVPVGRFNLSPRSDA